MEQEKKFTALVFKHELLYAPLFPHEYENQVELLNIGAPLSSHDLAR